MAQVISLNTTDLDLHLRLSVQIYSHSVLRCSRLTRDPLRYSVFAEGHWANSTRNTVTFSINDKKKPQHHHRDTSNVFKTNHKPTETFAQISYFSDVSPIISNVSSRVLFLEDILEKHLRHPHFFLIDMGLKIICYTYRYKYTNLYVYNYLLIYIIIIHRKYKSLIK